MTNDKCKQIVQQANLLFSLIEGLRHETDEQFVAEMLRDDIDFTCNGFDSLQYGYEMAQADEQMAEAVG